ncbi:Holliday junction ATP-dependent DNA helicase RuvA [Mannheimia haemolytica]|uniref:Holliday junction branch migration complex subunit RuvA n=1 Tax=Mannheimia haemolytica TaxID=75985 RepID=A0A378N872_MANHA|nr:Holliday junction ATP-dependent DNA helicase RuvA [Mannheimia haemolytica]
MIGRLHGKIIEKQPPEILLDVQGVGYELLLPMTSFYSLPQIGEEATIFTHLVVREDAHLLFGFAQKQDRTLFRELIKTNGVGPKLALAILSAMSVSQFATAIENEELAKLTKIPESVGKPQNAYWWNSKANLKEWHRVISLWKYRTSKLWQVIRQTRQMKPLMP